MKRDRFRLATVLRVRKIQEDAERGRLALARAGAGRATAHADVQTQRYQDTSVVTSPSGSAGSFVGARLHGERLADAVVVARSEVVAADVVVEDRRLDWSVAAQRVSALDRLHDRHREAFVAAALAEDVLDADERSITLRRRVAPEAVPIVPAARRFPPSSSAPAEL